MTVSRFPFKREILEKKYRLWLLELAWYGIFFRKRKASVTSGDDIGSFMSNLPRKSIVFSPLTFDFYRLQYLSTYYHLLIIRVWYSIAYCLTYLLHYISVYFFPKNIPEHLQYMHFETFCHIFRQTGCSSIKRHMLKLAGVGKLKVHSTRARKAIAAR